MQDLGEFVVKTPEEMEQLRLKGAELRVVAGHDMNERSSRSHSIFSIIVDNSYIDEKGEEHIKSGKLNLVDLAGSERQKKTNATGEVLDQAIHINQSLSCLGNVVAALVTGKSHIPYRDSKLTKLLQDSLGGNSKTVMIANIGPAEKNYDETVSTLRYADRAKQIKNAPRINEDPKDAMIRQYQEELNMLRQQLAEAGGGKVDADGKVIYSETLLVNKEKIMEIEDKFKKEKEEMELLLEEEKKKIASSKNTAEDDKLTLLEKLKQKQKEQEKQQKNKEKMIERLKKIEEKFVMGQETEKKAKENEEILLKYREQLEAQEKMRIELQNQIKENEDSSLSMKMKFSDQESEIKEKGRILEKLKGILKTLEQENKEILQENERKSAELYDTKRNIEKHMDYQDTVFDLILGHQTRNPDGVFELDR